ncbi:BON domain-containing protein [Methylophilus flavus]|uniref:BON domain-containing protein n=1 Tax=Methylophilus flavus TaxID=640084 RepID=A0ABW3PF27_9PROT
MTFKHILSLLLTAGLIFSALGYTADRDTHETNTYVKDSVITSKVKKNLAEEKLSNLVNIRVETDGSGEVTLKGKVTTQELADKAISIAQAVEGVNSVKSELKIVPKK